MQICIFFIYDHDFFAVAYVCKRTPAPEIAPKIIGLRIKLPEIVPITTNPTEPRLVDRCIFW